MHNQPSGDPTDDLDRAYLRGYETAVNVVREFAAALPAGDPASGAMARLDERLQAQRPTALD